MTLDTPTDTIPSSETHQPPAYLVALCAELCQLYEFARQINELDFAGALMQEFRGAQDEGWATTETAFQVYEEIINLLQAGQKSREQLRHILLLYCQLAEAGGVYETLKNMMGVVRLKPYNMWPFQDLVRVRRAPKAVIGPNANAMFKDLALSARSIGLTRLSTLLELAFRDDIRNGMYHGDYVLWSDGLRLRRRNGGHAIKLSFEQINEALSYGVGFFQLLTELNQASVASFDPPRTINGRFSSNPPMPWTVACDNEQRRFGISSSSPGPVKDAAYERQEAINGLLGGRVLSTYVMEVDDDGDLVKHIAGRGFEPLEVLMEPQAFQALSIRIDAENLWDSRLPRHQFGGLLMLSPWGFAWIGTPRDFDALLPVPILAVQIDEDKAGQAP